MSAELISKLSEAAEGSREHPTNDPTNPLHRLADDLQRGHFHHPEIAADVDYALRLIALLTTAQKETTT